MTPMCRVGTTWGPMQKAKILATLGPASGTPATMRRLIDAGADAFRFNFSHGTHEEHRRLFAAARVCAREAGRHIPLVQDLQGPKIRVDLAGGTPVELAEGDAVFLVGDPEAADAKCIRVAYPSLCEDLRTGEPVLLDDGKIVLEVVEVTGDRVQCKVRVGGLLRDGKGVHLPGTRTSLSPISEKDRADLAVGLEMGFDWVALSFVSSVEDIRLLRAEMDRLGRRVPVIAKLERPAAIDHLEEIAREADALMVARGDLGIELPVQRVPVIQKQVIETANRLGVPVITATQMLESMTVTTTPTRAEVTDVANAIYDGTDVVMLSAETSIGRHPVESVLTMREVIREAEAYPRGYTRAFTAFSSQETADEDGTTAHLAVQASRDMAVRAICVFTQSGRTALLASKFRPPVEIYAFCPEPAVVERLGLLWGVVPVPFPRFERSDELILALDRHLADTGLARPGERVAITFGSPPSDKCPSNMLRLHEVVGAAPR